MYGICLGNSNELYVLYCSPVLEKKFHLNINHSTEIYIGKDTANHISYNNELVANKHVRIFFNNGRWFIENFDSRFGTFVNNEAVCDRKRILFNGDVIYIMGLKIIIMGKNIFINNPQNNIICNKEVFTLIKDDQKEIQTNEEIEEKNENIELYSEDEYFSRAPRITNVIEREKVKIDAPPHIQDKEEMPLILVLGSSLSMGAMMIISIITAIDGKLSGTATTKQTIFTLIYSTCNTKY